jgi:hypothetical protein
MVKDSTYKTRSSNNIKKRIKYAFPYTWLTSDRTIGRCRNMRKHSFKTFFHPRRYATDGIMGAPPDERLLWFVDDNSNTSYGTPRKWLIIKQSNIPYSGAGVFAARRFEVGDVITKYIGKTADLHTALGKRKAVEWAKDRSMRKDYRMLFEFGEKRILVAADKYHEYLFGHFIQHSDNPNCVVDRKTGLMSAL